MTQTLKQRLEQAIERNPSARIVDIATACDVTMPSVSNWLSGKTKTIKPHVARRAANFFGCNPLWLAEGVGEPGWGSQIPSSETRSNITPTPAGTTRVPLISAVQAGALKEPAANYATSTNSDEWVFTDQKISPKSFAMKIQGDSMSPKFQQGDIVIFDPTINPQPGDFVVATTQTGEATFKKYRPRGTNDKGEYTFELVPLNEDYPTIKATSSEMMVVGTMIEHRTFRRRHNNV